MAIFSSADAQTKADFRNYNWKKPNRTVPYELPEVITNKIVELMDSFQMNTGSLDFIVNENNEYIFLEVNPTGQFGMVSFPCNYHLEKIVAQTLVERETAKALLPQL
jgi:glutathione synthase/RimK-type ligase-like ATP-grasp enzyme